jgi:hypothetical protein
MSEGSLEHQEIQPSNIISTGVVSFKNGNPVIQFIIGEQDKYLLGNSLRFCGNVQFFDNGAVPVSASQLAINSTLGLYGMLDQINISSQRSKQNIETIRHYGRFLSTYLPTMSNQQEAIGHLNATTGMMPNLEAQQLGVVNNQNGSSATDRTTFGTGFAMSLPCGLLNSQQPIPLSSKWGVGGLMLELRLAPDSQFLFAENHISGSLTDPFYQLRNLKLIYEVVNPSSDMLSRLNSQQGNTLEYNSISSYYTSVNSTNAIVNFNLGLKNCLSGFFNIIPSSRLNNLAEDGYATLPFTNTANNGVAKIKQLIFTRNGVKYPLQYNIDTNVNPKFIASGTDYYVQDPQVLRNAMDSFMPFSDYKKTQLSPSTYTRDLDSNNRDSSSPLQNHFFVGVSFDNISNQGVDFGSAQFGVQMELDLTTDNPQTIFLFIHHKSTLVFSPNGLQVLN